MALDPCQNQALDSFENQTRRTSYPYFSKVKFLAERTGDEGGPYVYTVPRGLEVRAFSYAINDSREAAGYTQSDGVATKADTNQSDKNKTTSGQNLIVRGIALQVLPVAFHVPEGGSLPHTVIDADWKLLASLWNSVAVEVILNGGENVFKLGIMGMIPGAGGLSGGAPSKLKAQALGSMDESLPFATNSWPVRNNFFKLPEGLVWRNQSNADSMFNLRFTVTRAIALNSGGDAQNAALSGVDTAPALDTGQPGYLYPPKLAVEVMAFLIGEVVGPRTHAA
jgi:hypothetical protein